MSGTPPFSDLSMPTPDRVAGVRVGHWSDRDAATGCTVVLFPPGTTGSVAVPGRAPATRETDVVRPGGRVRFVHGVVLTGGSAYGLDSAGGVMRVLEGQGIGHETPAGLVPIVPTAAIFDLLIGSSKVRPGVAEGEQAALAASDDRPEGLVGAATGATCGKYAGWDVMSKTGFGVASGTFGGVTVEAFAVCNAVGDIIDADGTMLAGCRAPDALATRNRLIELGDDAESWITEAGEATTIACVVTNAILAGDTCTELARQVASEAFAAAIAPPGTLWDGDTLFLCATNQVPADPQAVGRLASDVLARAIRRCAATGEALAGVPGSVK